MTSRHLFYGAINSKYFFFIVFVFLLALYGAHQIFYKKHKLNLKKRWLLIFITITIALYFISAFLGVFSERSLQSDIVRSSGVLFLASVGLLAYLLSEFLSKEDWTLIRRSIAISGGIFGLFTILGAEGFGLTSRFLWTNLGIGGFTFGNSTFAGVYLVLAFISGLIELFRFDKKSKRFWVLVTSLLFIIFSPIIFNIGIFWKGALSEVFSNPLLLIGSARASSVTAWAVILFLIGWSGIKRISNKQIRKYFFSGWSILWVAGMFTGIALLFTSGSFVQEKYIQFSSEARIIVWDSGFQAWKERPILGWGSENFNYVFENHFDNRLYLDKNFGEVWFDKAHNIFIDTLVDVGVLGFLAIILVIAYFLFVIRRAFKKDLISNFEAIILSILPFAHILQLQTGFDTPGTFALLALFGGYALYLEKEMVSEVKEINTESKINVWVNKSFAILLALISVFGLKYLFLDEYGRQFSLFKTFTTGDNKIQEKYVKDSLSRISDFESLRLSSNSFVKGLLELMASPNFNKAMADIALSRLSLYEERYRAYLEEVPDYYRARMNLAHILLMETVLGKNRIAEAREIIKDSYSISPQNPLTYAMDALADLYVGNIKGAKEKMNAGIALNPDIPFSKEIMAYIERQEKSFPTVTVLKLENL